MKKLKPTNNKVDLDLYLNSKKYNKIFEESYKS